MNLMFNDLTTSSQMILNPSSSFTLWKIYPLLMNSSLSLGSTPVKKTEVAAALVIPRHLFPILKGVFLTSSLLFLQ